jgi:hypothetical protein
MREGFWRGQDGKWMLSKSDSLSFYAIQGVSLVIEFDESWCMDLIGIFPSVVAFGIPFPFDQILQGLVASPFLMGTDLFHLVFFFSINQIRRRSCEVWSV